jgi:hypothetical protein
MSAALLIKETSGESLSVITDSTHHINKAVLFPRSNYVHHTSEEVINSLDGQEKTCLL